MQYVADPGDFRNLAKNIQITFTVYRLAACKGTVFLTLCSFLQKLGFRHFLFLFFFFRTTSSLHMLVVSYDD